MRKFADKEQTNGSKTETTLSSVDTRGSWPIDEKIKEIVAEFGNLSVGLGRVRGVNPIHIKIDKSVKSVSGTLDHKYATLLKLGEYIKSTLPYHHIIQ